MNFCWSFENDKGVVPEGSKFVSIAFIIHINDLQLIISPDSPEDERNTPLYGLILKRNILCVT